MESIVTILEFLSKMNIMKILKLFLIFIGSIPIYISINYLLSIIIYGTFTTENLILNSTSYAVAITCIAGYKLFKKSQKESE